MSSETAEIRQPVTAGRDAHPLRSRRFRLLASGQLVSSVGDGIYAVALPWYVLSQHGSAILLGTVLAAYGIPRTALIMVGGQLADRLRPWTVMLGADLGRLVLAAALAVLATVAHPGLATLAPIAFGLGAGQGLFLPASFSIMPRIMTGERLQAGNALMSASTQLAAFAGPALGGLVVAAAGPATGFWLDSASFAVSALTLWRLGAAAPESRRAAPEQRHEQDEPQRHGQDEAGRAGRQDEPQRLWPFVRREPIIPLLMVIMIAGNLGVAGTTEVALPVFARADLHAGADGYGLLVAGFGVGALAGALLAARLRPRRRPVLLAGLVFLLQAPLIAALALARNLPETIAITASWGLLSMWAGVVTQTAFQRWAPPALLGRLNGMTLTTSYGMFPLSVALAGLVVRHAGPGAFFILAAVLMAGSQTWALSHRIFRDFGAQAGEQE